MTLGFPQLEMSLLTLPVFESYPLCLTRPDVGRSDLGAMKCLDWALAFYDSNQGSTWGWEVSEERVIMSGIPIWCDSGFGARD